ncbi:protein kinase [Nonomuraea sp. NN258]|uniref:protein kinase domain-containing protein n=1 Tax=Nonomuraea antri TaxID=2730852 RepID=UPI0015693596|nr:glycoside hydrolase family 6 protein [Nonomuraea antri]NRQ35626.1 protein kinase [Nonomuraea antri]
MTLAALRDGDPRHVGPYTLLGRLGEGGMGVVYLAEGADGGRVAVKLIHARMDADPGFRRRFAREVAAAQRVARFCTAPVLAADVENDPAYLVTEYVEGPSLDDAVKESGPLRGSALDGLAAAMAMALNAIHGAGVVHRDLKPSNVLLSQVGPKVIDFGIAQLAGAEISSSLVGTPAYMSPEQVSGAQIGPASDVFSWGCTVAFAAGGASPFGAASVPTILMRIVTEPPDVRGLTGPLRDLVLESLAKDPADRPTAQDLMNRLSATPPMGAFPAAPVPVTPPPPATEDEKPAVPTVSPDGPPDGPADGRRKRLLAAAAAVLVAVAGVTTAVLWPDGSGGVPAATENTDDTARASVTRGNPVRAAGVRFHLEANSGAAAQAVSWRQDRRADAALMSRLAQVPQAVRLDDGDIRSRVATVLDQTKRSGDLPVFVANVLGGNDCTPLEPAYRQWIESLGTQIGDAPAVVILEPNSLAMAPGTKQCAGKGSAAHRYRDIAQAVKTLKRHPNLAVYLDGSTKDWPETAEMAERLVAAGIADADGFFLNAVGYQRTQTLLEYGPRLSACVSVLIKTGRTGCPQDVPVAAADLPHFVIDTSRNGQGSWDPKRDPAHAALTDPMVWCNPPGRGTGDLPTTRTGDPLADAYLWLNDPGLSNGDCPRGEPGTEDPVRGTRSPGSGRWWAELALERAELANPELP